MSQYTNLTQKKISLYDEACAREFEILSRTLQKYFVEITVSCPYNLPYSACFYQGMFGSMPDHTMELFLAAGYRRNGNCLYAMHCQDCTACIPIRIHPQSFRPNRNQRRVIRKNSDVEVTLGPLKVSDEDLAVCSKFLEQRYPHKGNTAEGYYSGFFLNTITATMELRYTKNDKLIGNGIIDIGDNWMNAVYFYFDPDEGQRSAGIYNILKMIEICCEKNIEHLYLGYYIREVSAMSYKKFFKPHYLLLDSRWQEMR